jgi:hypothetical protein
MFKSSKDPAVSPEFEREWILELGFYSSLSQLITNRIEALQMASISEAEQMERKLSLILFLQSMHEQAAWLSKAILEKQSLKTTAPLQRDEPPCRS